MRFICWLTLLGTTALADTRWGHFLQAHDGDSIQVMWEVDKAVGVIRLAGADAPEVAPCGGQPLGKQARAALIKELRGQRVRVVTTGVVTFQRIVANVYVGDSMLSVSEILVRSGLAWRDPRFDRGPLVAAEAEAKVARRGVHSRRRMLVLPRRHVPPWEWRKTRAKCGEE